MRFAFYGRVSTEDQQDPTSSKGWQLSRSRALIEPHDGEVVAEYFDVGQSRSIPWKRRPRARDLLDAFPNPRRGFDAVVIGEPARAFYGQQFGLTFPVFVHYGVELWVPEVGGRVDPGSDAHDLVMALYGGMSKGERNRIKVRVRSAMAVQAQQEGRFLGGRPPYGYRLADAGPHPNPAKAAAGVRAHRLEPDPVTAPIVRRIFDEYVRGRGLYAIAEGLTRDGIPSPSGHDPARNRHRASAHGAWGKSAVRAILRNPRYTGRQVWNKQRRDEVLIDVEDVAAGHESKMRWNDPSQWVWSAEVVHEALVTPEAFSRAQEVARAGMHRPLESKRRATTRRYVLSGLVHCGDCERKMNGAWIHGRAYYRCAFPREYALTKRLADHPRTLAVREEVIVPALDSWLAQVFHPRNIDATVEALTAAGGGGDEAATARAEAARRKISDCDERLARYRSLVEAGTDPKVVSAWIAEVQGERLAAERELARTVGAEPLTADEVRRLVRAVKDPVKMLRQADPALKATIYADLGVRLEYVHGERLVRVEAMPTAYRTARVGDRT